jgi:phosphatidylserine/phosphatidylglycerophosphate/cardiolipin synthase-like enzyme
MTDEFITAIEILSRKAPAAWLISACEKLRELPPTATADFAFQSMPTTNNADLIFQMGVIVCMASGRMSWEALSWTLNTNYASYNRWQAEQHIELLWAGPSPGNQIATRRIDQCLYDLIAKARCEILLVTFAAARIERLTDALLNAAQRGVRTRLILEFSQSSEGQLSYDALRAFPASLIAAAEVFYWPIEKRERNQAGRPGKLHAKVAIADGTMLLSSANLTDDAFNRNLEVGVMMDSPVLLKTTISYFDSLISDGTLCRLE